MLHVAAHLFQGPYGVACALAGVDLVSFTALSMENESDPRCLLHSLKCVKVSKLAGAAAAAAAAAVTTAVTTAAYWQHSAFAERSIA
jgi:hypothetical protein